METWPLQALAGLFAIAAAVAVASGVVLARCANEISERTGLGAMFVGMLLLAGATSLPELTTAVSAALADAPDLAVADLFGAGMANMATLAVVHLLRRGRGPGVEFGQARLAGAAIVLCAIAVIGIVAPRGIGVGWIGIETLLIGLAYVAVAHSLRRPPAIRPGGPEAREVGLVLPRRAAVGYGTLPIGRIYLRFAVATVAILAFAPILALAGQEIAVATGLGETVVGALLLALSTSSPELVSSIAAVRMGAYELAVGNLFGSNAFNMMTLLAADAAFDQGPILAAVDPSVAVTGLGSILMMAIALAAVVSEGEAPRRGPRPGALLLLLVWLIMIIVLLGAGQQAT